MRRPCLVLTLVLAFSTFSYAGKISGSITEAGKPIPQGMKVDVACGSSNYTAQTDNFGAFNLFAAAEGKCVLKLAYQGQTPTIDINSYAGSAQYDLVLEKADGKYALKRK
jgi:hypothetical protein